MPRAATTHPGTRVLGVWGRWVLLVTALTQALSSVLTSFTGQVGTDPVVVPPGPFFAVWGLIIIGGLASALWGMPRPRATTAPYARIQGPVALAQVGFTAWLLAAVHAPGWIVPVFLVMLAALAWSLRAIVLSSVDRITRVLLGTTVGLYTGWSAAAVWLNAATLLPAPAASDPVVLGLLLAGAVATLLAGVIGFRAQGGFVAAGMWALLGVTISTASAGAMGLSTVALMGLLLVVAAAVLVRRRRLIGQGRSAEKGVRGTS